MGLLLFVPKIFPLFLIRSKHEGGFVCWLCLNLLRSFSLGRDFDAEGVCDWRLLCLKMEVGDSSKKYKAKKICYNGLIDRLFSWTLEDVLYDDLYKDEVLSLNSDRLLFSGFFLSPWYVIRLWLFCSFFILFLWFCDGKICYASWWCWTNWQYKQVLVLNIYYFFFPWWIYYNVYHLMIFGIQK